jgi:Signal transduction histidine kinase
VSADSDGLYQAVENLFRNAVEHEGESVTVRVGALDRGFYVEDDGPGVPADRREEVFDHGVTTTEDGGGYRLSVVRPVVNAHGWDITATDSESGGVRFEVTGVDFLK